MNELLQTLCDNCGFHDWDSGEFTLIPDIINITNEEK